MEKDELFCRHMADLAARAQRSGMAVYSDFLDLHELHMVHHMNPREPGVALRFWGGYDEAERQMVSFLPDALIFDEGFPIDCICIRPLQDKFAETLTHRDYLGALMKLGFERSCLGDILVDDHKAYVYCHRKMSGLLLSEVSRIRRTSVELTLESPDFIPPLKLQELNGSVASLRLDCILGECFGLSRSKIIPYIEKGLVYVEGKQITSNGYTLHPGDRISVRGLGKCRFVDSMGLSKKGKVRVRILRYI